MMFSDDVDKISRSVCLGGEGTKVRVLLSFPVKISTICISLQASNQPSNITKVDFWWIDYDSLDWPEGSGYGAKLLADVIIQSLTIWCLRIYVHWSFQRLNGGGISSFFVFWIVAHASGSDSHVMVVGSS
ncbi:hypothetical protein V6N13_024526 [Hibiscus sabdariffa]